ncbi:MAG: hypothetical protein PHE17_09740 [Thiothrix sp.]|uniref:hypothetical protein n=1 Tax=Thiothrix sp. TaxID=1032 RepID=UPI002601FDCD|nr:hypothetical protein [Thiothrix sp.]MDD5393288.1 hypothetical protein [Thiothrix sp.]
MGILSSISKAITAVKNVATAITNTAKKVVTATTTAKKAVTATTTVKTAVPATSTAAKKATAVANTVSAVGLAHNFADKAVATVATKKILSNYDNALQAAKNKPSTAATINARKIDIAKAGAIGGTKALAKAVPSTAKASANVVTKFAPAGKVLSKVALPLAAIGVGADARAEYLNTGSKSAATARAIVSSIDVGLGIAAGAVAVGVVGVASAPVILAAGVVGAVGYGAVSYFFGDGVKNGAVKMVTPLVKKAATSLGISQPSKTKTLSPPASPKTISTPASNNSVAWKDYSKLQSATVRSFGASNTKSANGMLAAH